MTVEITSNARPLTRIEENQIEAIYSIPEHGDCWVAGVGRMLSCRPMEDAIEAMKTAGIQLISVRARWHKAVYDTDINVKLVKSVRPKRYFGLFKSHHRSIVEFNSGTTLEVFDACARLTGKFPHIRPPLSILALA